MCEKARKKGKQESYFALIFFICLHTLSKCTQRAYTNLTTYRALSTRQVVSTGIFYYMLARTC